jgi:hypothetical protein
LVFIRAGKPTQDTHSDDDGNEEVVPRAELHPFRREFRCCRSPFAIRDPSFHGLHSEALTFMTTQERRLGKLKRNFDRVVRKYNLASRSDEIADLLTGGDEKISKARARFKHPHKRAFSASVLDLRASTLDWSCCFFQNIASCPLTRNMLR